MTNLTATDNRLYATDCAALVHHIWQRQYPTDMAVRTLIETTRQFWQREATAVELEAADAADAAVDNSDTSAWGAKVAAKAAAAVDAVSARWAALYAVGRSEGEDAWLIVRSALIARREEYINGTAGEPWELDNGERLKEILR